MKRTMSFSVRVAKEILRDPLSYIFCIAFPLVMLIVMTLVNDSIPKQANLTIFRIDNLAGGVAVFGQTFIMLFTCLVVSKDRSGAFLTRLYATPMTSMNFIAGYLCPVLILTLVQMVITMTAGIIVSLITGVEMNPLGILTAAAALIPSSVLMTSFGLLFGSLLGEKAAPGICSIIISAATFLGGIFFDAESTGGVMLNVCNVLPFFHAVKCARQASVMALDNFWLHEGVVIAYAVVVTAVAMLVFRSQMKADLQ